MSRETRRIVPPQSKSITLASINSQQSRRMCRIASLSLLILSIGERRAHHDAPLCLPTKLCYEILEHAVLELRRPLEALDVDKLDPEDWYSPIHSHYRYQEKWLHTSTRDWPACYPNSRQRSYISCVKLLKLVFHTKLPLVLHWAHVRVPRFWDDEESLVISLHPY